MSESAPKVNIQEGKQEIEGHLGEIWGERYRIKKRLGEGGMGVVWLAHDEKMGRDVVIKRLHTDLLNYERALERFKREISALANSNSPYVVTAYDCIEFPGTGEHDVGLVMEYVQGKDLFDTLHDEKFFDEKRAAEVATQISRALATAHMLGIVHCDLKPENVFMDKIGNDSYAKVGDFGTVGFVSEEWQARTDPKGKRHMTTPGTVLGTPEFLSPEQISGEKIDGRADLYALGVIMYRMLTGLIPFRGKDKSKIIQQQISEPPKPFLELATMPEPNKNTILEPIVMKLLEKDPAKRFQTALEAAQAIQDAILKKYPELPFHQPFERGTLSEEKILTKQEKRNAA